MGRRKSFKDFAKSMTTANEFVKQLYMTKNVRRDLSEYLPREFTVLGLSERKRLACLLSWEGLKVWGFDAFEVEKLTGNLSALAFEIRNVSNTLKRVIN